MKSVEELKDRLEKCNDIDKRIAALNPFVLNRPWTEEEWQQLAEIYKDLRDMTLELAAEGTPIPPYIQMIMDTVGPAILNHQSNNDWNN